MILNKKIFVLSDFKSTFLQRVRFYINFFTTPQILNNLPKSTTCTFHIVLLHITMYSYSLQYLRQLDISNHHRSNNTSFTRFRKDLDFWFCYGVPLYSLYGLDICKNLLLPIKLMISILQLLLSHRCLSSFLKNAKIK